MWDALSYTKAFDCCGDNGCMWYMRSLIRFAPTARWTAVSDYPSWTIPSITSMNSFECNPTNVVPYGYNGCLVIGDELAMVGLPVWSWYFGFVIRRPRLCSCKWFARGEFLSNNNMSLKCAWIYVLFGSAIRTGTKMGSGTHSCRYLLQSNQYCNLFGLAKWISVNLNQTKCNATW